jgi:hypothetical protein
MQAGAEVPEDPWAGVLDEDGFPLERDEVYGVDTAPHVVTGTPAELSTEEAIATRYRLPEEFWGSRELFKSIRQAAWATQTHPDAVLACVLARAAGAAGHEVTFNTGKSPSTLSLFACLLAPSGIGKSDAYKTATRLVRLPSHLCLPDGAVNMDIFRDGLNISTGEGLAEGYMGTVEVEATNPDGSVKLAVKGRGRNAVPEPEMVKVRRAVRHRAFFFVDEGEILTKLMHERSGATLGGHLRTAWSGGTLSQANASEDRYRFVPGGSYTMGVVIGYQPETAVAMLSEVGPGTPQRFLWFGAQDTEMPDPEEEFDFPDSITLPSEEHHAVEIVFPAELRRWFRRHTWGKHHRTIQVNPMDSHEPLMRAKLAAEFCWLDGRRVVSQDDWTLAGMIWSVSCAIRDRLIRHRDTLAEQAREEKRAARVAEATEIEVLRVTVTADVERVARRIARRVFAADDAFETVKAYRLKKDFGRDKPMFDAGLAHARRMGWIGPDGESGSLQPGPSRPAE